MCDIGENCVNKCYTAVKYCFLQIPPTYIIYTILSSLTFGGNISSKSKNIKWLFYTNFSLFLLNNWLHYYQRQTCSSLYQQYLLALGTINDRKKSVCWSFGENIQAVLTNITVVSFTRRLVSKCTTYHFRVSMLLPIRSLPTAIYISRNEREMFLSASLFNST